jgi:hypothetical protein
LRTAGTLMEIFVRAVPSSSSIGRLSNLSSQVARLRPRYSPARRAPA